ncbi:integrase core domain-containing protein [Aurantiacibacter flavus]|uniref:integrase core domain-containing protein n=1 Tax=Aurantiacibacter flavus TaxID=3145232 RepID=UPI003D1E88D1
MQNACEKLEAWRRHYNEERPHSAIGNIPPIMLSNSAGETRPPDLGKAGNSRPEWSEVGWQGRRSETLPLNGNDQGSTSATIAHKGTSSSGKVA